MADERLQRRLAAILSADMVGYSHLMGRDESGTLARLKWLRHEIIDPTVAAHSGRTVKLMGDGTLIEFASAVDAVTCAVTLQQRIAEHNAGSAEDGRIEFRIGINVGDIIVDGDDIYGDGVNVAARIEALAEPGSIYISRAVADHVRGKVSVAIEARGARRVKNIAQPIEVFSVSAEMNDVAATPREIADKPSIAVLAFSNMSGDPEQEYFSDGIADDIITSLSKLPELHVIARNSSFTYKGKPVDVKRVGRELGVRTVLEGSVRKSGNRVRVSGQLIDAETPLIFGPNATTASWSIFSPCRTTSRRRSFRRSRSGSSAPTDRKRESRRTIPKPTIVSCAVASSTVSIRARATKRRGICMNARSPSIRITPPPMPAWPKPGFMHG